jgi:Tol biopolymer transport system component
VAGTVLDLAGALKALGRDRAADSLFQYGLALYRRVAATAAFTTPSFSAGAPSPRSRLTTTSHTTFNTRIVFVTDRDGPDPVGHQGRHEIYSMNPDGSDQLRLTHSDVLVSGPALSPDGRKIAYNKGLIDIYIINADGSDTVRLTNLAGTERGGALSPTWSPDGQRIAFQNYIRPDIYVINVDGTGLSNLTNNPARDWAPDWSPDGRRIAFLSNRDGTREIYVMNADGTDPVRLTTNVAVDTGTNLWMSPAWSPDGRKIAFTSDRDGKRDLYVIDADGTNMRKLTETPSEDGGPAWSPDGRQVAFYRRVLGHSQIFVMNVNGTGLTRLTESSTGAFSRGPSWGPIAAKH